MGEPTTVLDVIPEEERNLRGLELAERHFPPERRAQIASFLEVPVESPALLPYLAWCAANDFSPIAGHVWLIPKKIKGQDGSEERTIYKPAVGRDGLLHRARSTKGKPGGYRGMQFGVVCERDTFEVEYTGDIDKDPKVLHRYASKPTEFDEGEAPDRYRGRIIGGWAKCYIEGEPPVFYYANLREHGRLRQVWAWNQAANGRRPLWLDANGQQTFDERDANGQPHRPVQEWEGAWDYLSTMILKSAQSYVLRIGLGITGVVPVDELRDPHAWSQGDAGAGDTAGVVHVPPAEYDFDSIENAELRERLRHAVETANEQEPFVWGPAKCEMVFHGRTEDELAGIAEQIESENDLREKRLAGEPEAEAAPEVVDAELVEDDPHVQALRTQLEVAQKDLAKAKKGTPEEASLRAEVDQLEAQLRDSHAG